MHKDAESGSGSLACTWLLIPWGAPLPVSGYLSGYLSIAMLPPRGSHADAAAATAARGKRNLQLSTLRETHRVCERERGGKLAQKAVRRAGEELGPGRGKSLQLPAKLQHLIDFHSTFILGCSRSGASFQRLWPSLELKVIPPVKVLQPQPQRKVGREKKRGLAGNSTAWVCVCVCVCRE